MMSAGKAGTTALALSLKVRSTFEAERPASDMSLMPLLSGLARRRSMSWVDVLVKPKRLTVTFCTAPGTHLTGMREGYGVAEAKSLVAMGLEFESTSGLGRPAPSTTRVALLVNCLQGLVISTE